MTALELFYCEGLSVGELAQVLEVPPGTGKSRLYRGRTPLREGMSRMQRSVEDERSLRVQFDAWVARMQELGSGEEPTSADDANTPTD